MPGGRPFSEALGGGHSDKAASRGPGARLLDLAKAESQM